MKKWFCALLLFLMICLPALADVVIPPDFFRPTPRVTETVAPSPMPTLSPIVVEPSPGAVEPATGAVEPEGGSAEPDPNAVEPRDGSVEPNPNAVEPAPEPESSPEPVSGNFILTVATVLMAASLGLWMGIRAHKGK